MNTLSESVDQKDMTLEQMFRRSIADAMIRIAFEPALDPNMPVPWEPREGLEFLDRLSKLSKMINKIRDLYCLFLKTGRVGGQEGVASFLGISRNSVYVKIKSLGLTASQFLSPGANVDSLIRQSTAIKNELQDILPLIRKYGLDSPSELIPVSSLG